MEKKNQKKFLVLNIISFQSETTNSDIPEQDTCQWQSMHHETPVRFNISRRDIFSKLSSLRVMKKYDESALMQILKQLGTLYLVDSQRLL